MNNIILIIALLVLTAESSHAEMYKWVDENGKVHFSDKKPHDREAKNLSLTPSNIIDGKNTGQSDSDPENLYTKDNFRLPSRKSNVPYRFIMTSALNIDEPTDRLSSIKIGPGKKSFTSYIKLTGIESNKEYKLRVRIIDAKGELVFDKDKVLKSQSNSAWFAARVSPKINIDEPGKWKIQGILNNKRLFVESRTISFNPSL